MAQRLKRLPLVQETRVWSLGREDPLEKEMAIHSSILAGRIPWTEKPSRLQSTGSQRVRHDWATSPSPSPSRELYKVQTPFMSLQLFKIKRFLNWKKGGGECWKLSLATCYCSLHVKMPKYKKQIYNCLCTNTPVGVGSFPPVAWSMTTDGLWVRKPSFYSPWSSLQLWKLDQCFQLL